MVGLATLSVSSEIFKAVGRPKHLVRVHFMRLCVMALLIPAGALLAGPVGVALALSVSQFVAAAYALHLVAPLIRAGRTDLREALIGPAVASSAMLLVMLAFAATAPPLGHALGLELVLTALEVILGAGTYATVLFAIDPVCRRVATESATVRRCRRLLVRAS